MRLRNLAWLFGLVLVASAPAQAAESEAQRLERGEVLVRTQAVAGSDLPRVTGRGVIGVPPARLWAFVQDCNRYAGRMPRVTRSRERSRQDAVAICETTSKLPFPVGSLTSVTRAVHEAGPPRWVRRWTLIEGDYLHNSGSWTLEPWGADGQRTLLTYQTHVEPRTSVPDAVLRAAQKRGMPDLFEALRKLARAGGY